jgi:pimeloyl-ACP methyl ester carboxylesterase
MSHVARSITTVAGIRSPILRTGDPESSESVVFVHGNPGWSGDWLDLLDAVGPFSRGIAMDMPGFGKSEKPADFDYSVPGYATHLGRLLDNEGIRRVHLVLHDFGGPWGLAWAAENVERVASITLINIGILPGYRWHRMARLWRTPVVGELVMAMTTRAGLGLAMRHGTRRSMPEAYVREAYDHFDAATRKAVLKLYRSTRSVGSMSSALGARLAPHRLPALVVWGARDPFVPVEFAETQRKFFAVDQVVRLEDSGHWPMIDDPAAVRTAVVAFLRPRTSS